MIKADSAFVHAESTTDSRMISVGHNTINCTSSSGTRIWTTMSLLPHWWSPFLKFHTLPSAPFTATNTFPHSKLLSTSLLTSLPGQPSACCDQLRATYVLTARPHVPGVSPSNETRNFNDYLKDVLICTSLLHSASSTYEIWWCLSSISTSPPKHGYILSWRF